jgi:SOS-response transcriptional repressor LexA
MSRWDEDAASPDELADTTSDDLYADSESWPPDARLGDVLLHLASAMDDELCDPSTLTDELTESGAYHRPAFARWLTADAHARATPAERVANARAAGEFAQRIRTRVMLEQVEKHVTVHPLRARTADLVGTIEQVGLDAKRARCAPWLETLAVAAGNGLELWDEQCERWVELPNDAAKVRYVALNVSGDSMVPFLYPRDVLLVRVGAPVREGALVVALQPDHGYVVKHLSRVTRRDAVLESFNPRYAPIHIPRTPGCFFGVVTHVLRQPDTSAL